jgi:hypothetical protein
MPWVVTIRNLVEDRVQIVTPEMTIPHDDPMFENEVHIVPAFFDKTAAEPEEAALLFGIHEFTRGCPCGPRVVQACGQRDMVLHNLIN